MRLSCISRNSEWRTSGELAKSMSPETSKIVVLSWCRAEICTVSTPSENAVSLRQILDEPQPVHGTVTGRHACFLDHENQSVSANVHQHEGNIIGWGALAPGSYAIENSLFHFVSRQARCFAYDFLDAFDSEHFSLGIENFCNSVCI